VNLGREEKKSQAHLRRHLYLLLGEKIRLQRTCGEINSILPSPRKVSLYERLRGPDALENLGDQGVRLRLLRGIVESWEKRRISPFSRTRVLYSRGRPAPGMPGSSARARVKLGTARPSGR